jgi:hypothetical protein
MERTMRKLRFWVIATVFCAAAAYGQAPHRHHKLRLPKLHVYTVATLPSAAAAGDGAIGLVSDARGIGETYKGGGQIHTLVVSNGHEWISH